MNGAKNTTRPRLLTEDEVRAQVRTHVTFAIRLVKNGWGAAGRIEDIVALVISQQGAVPAVAGDAAAKLIENLREMVAAHSTTAKLLIRAADALAAMERIAKHETCEYLGCDAVAIARIVDMEDNWCSWCHEHAIADLTSGRERGA